MKDLPDEFLFNGNIFCAEDYLEEVSRDTDDAAAVEEIVEASFLDDEFTTKWKPYRVELIKNKQVESEFDEKKQDLLIRGRKGNELEELWTFVVENNVATLDTVCAMGLQTHESDYNALGYSRLGVYVCRNADIAVQHALIKHASTQVIRLLVCKCVTGRQTTAIPRPATASEFIEPTQGYDCHVSALPPTLSDPLQTQYDRAQIYCYEINKLLQPSTRPRQVFPYAVITYTENGAYVPAVDAKPTAKEKLAGNPRLQEIIKAINAKADKPAAAAANKNGAEPSSSPGAQTANAGLLQGPTVITGSPSPSSSVGSPGACALPPPPTAGLPPGAGILGGIPTGPQSPPLPGVLNGGSPPNLPTIPTIVNGHLNGMAIPGAMACMSRPEFPAGIQFPGFEGNPQLKAIISQINARLEAEQKIRPPPVSAGLLATGKGDGLLPSPPGTSATPPGAPVLSAPVSIGLEYRPSSTEGLLSASVASPNPTLPPGLQPPQRMLQLPEAALKGPPLTAMGGGHPAAVAGKLNGNIAAANPVLAARKNALVDPLAGQYQFAAAAAGLQQAAALQSFSAAGAPRFTAAGIGAGMFSMASMAGIPSFPGSAAAHSYNPAMGLPFYGTLPAAVTPPSATASLTTVPQTQLPMRTALKRPFPDAALLEWDKRPKYF